MINLNGPSNLPADGPTNLPADLHELIFWKDRSFGSTDNLELKRPSWQHTKNIGICCCFFSHLFLCFTNLYIYYIYFLFMFSMCIFAIFILCISFFISWLLQHSYRASMCSRYSCSLLKICVRGFIA